MSCLLVAHLLLYQSSGGRTIIFAETKDAVSTLAGVLPGARALHGDIQQSTREVRNFFVLYVLIISIICSARVLLLHKNFAVCFDDVIDKLF